MSSLLGFNRGEIVFHVFSGSVEFCFISVVNLIKKVVQECLKVFVELSREDIGSWYFVIWHLIEGNRDFIWC